MKNQETLWNKLYSNKLNWKKEAKDLPRVLEGKSVLELGVGTGKTLGSIIQQNPKSVTAIDFSQEALKKVQDSIDSNIVRLIKANLLDLPFNEEFDAVVCYYVLDNLLENERKQAILQISKALKQGGIILFEDFGVGDFREKEGSKSIGTESHTIEREDGLICHFFGKKEVESLFKSFKRIKTSEKTLHPIRTSPKLERKIISAIITK